MTRWLSTAFVWAGMTLCATAGWAAPKVTQVAFAGAETTLNVVVQAQRPIDPTQVEKALTDRGRVLELRIGGIEHPKTRFIKHKDRQVARIQAVNARRRAPAALRVEAVEGLDLTGVAVRLLILMKADGEVAEHVDDGEGDAAQAPLGEGGCKHRVRRPPLQVGDGRRVHGVVLGEPRRARQAPKP